MSTIAAQPPKPSEGMPLWRSQDIGKKYLAAERSNTAASPLVSPAQQLIKQSGVLSYPSASPLRIFDNACGTGMVTNLLQNNPEFKAREGGFDILCGDLSDGMIDAAKTRGMEDGWEGVNFQVVDAQDTKLPSESFTHILINFGVMLFPNPQAALSGKFLFTFACTTVTDVFIPEPTESWRLLKPGGTLGFTTWKQLEWPSLVDLGLARLGPPCPRISTLLDSLSPMLIWSDAEFVKSQLVSNPAQSFKDIKVESLEFNTPVTAKEVESGGSGVMYKQIVMSSWSEGDREAWGDKMLPAIGDALRERHGEKEFAVNWVAVVTTATKPI